MASRVIHLAVAYELAARNDIKDTARFYFGHMLPDMVMGEYEVRLPLKQQTHFYTLLPSGRKTYDFMAFYNDYKDKLSDTLYLGYYFHLIEDDIFRQYLYYRVGLLKRRGEKKLLDEIYSDYHKLNHLLCDKYGLTLPTVPDGLENEPVYKRFDFTVNEWLDEMKEDLSERTEGTLMHFTRELIAEFINECADVISKEYESILHGTHYLDINTYSIENYYKGELRK